MYNVEDGIDFYSAICQPDVDEENTCLITNEILEDDFKLLNYEKFNNLEDFNNFFLK